MGSDLDSYFIQVVAKRKLNNTHFAVAQDVFTLHVSRSWQLREATLKIFSN